jgi:hypothetical protein
MSRTLPFIALLSGFVGWSIAFLTIYAVQATGCHLGWQDINLGPLSALRLMLLATLGAVLIGLSLLGFWWRKRFTGTANSENFSLLRHTGIIIHCAAIGATAVTFAGVAWLSLC